jgi:signal transduction histidine kinase
MHLHGHPVAPWTRGLKAAVGFCLALTVLLIMNLLVYQKMCQLAEDSGESPQAVQMLRLLVITNLVVIVFLSGLVLWIHRQLSQRDADDRAEKAARVEEEVQLRDRIAELSRVNQTLQAETAERRHLASQLKRFQKMETLGKLVGSVAHEFNNYLTVIVGFSEQLSHQLPPGTMEYMTVTEILKAGERSAELTRGLLGLARTSDSNVRLIDVNRQVEAMRRMLSVLLGKRVRLEIVLEGGLPLIEAVPGHFEQVLLNLAANARDAMPQGGQLSVETRALTLDALCEGVPQGRYVLLTAADTGCGINEETRRRMFEPFYTTKEQGTGLGLATVEEIVRSSRGYVVADSLPGQGTTFKVYWPVAAHNAELGTLNTGDETQQVMRSDRATMRMKID